MASEVSIAIRKQDAINRIGKALGVDIHVQGRDANINDAIRLERIADAAEGKRATGSLAAALLNAKDSELAELPYVGERGVDRVREWAKENNL